MRALLGRALACPAAIGPHEFPLSDLTLSRGLLSKRSALNGHTCTGCSPKPGLMHDGEKWRSIRDYETNTLK
jgi:hypothetical protein